MNLKEMAAREAVKSIEDGMVVGLGSGSTASIAIRLIGDMVRSGTKIVGVPTSRESEELARSVGIPIGELKHHPLVDITIDGADEVDPELNLVKGLGGALVREKIVAAATEVEIIVVDDSKLVDFICQKAPLPVEVVRFGYEATLRKLSALGCRPEMRRFGDELFVTDNGNYIADCRFARIDDPSDMERTVNMIPGMVENGLFIGIAKKVIVASGDGIRSLDRTGR